MFEETNCDAVMIGRGALGNPWFFKQAISLYNDNKKIDNPSIKEKISYCRKHFIQMLDWYGEKVGVNMMRKHFGWYFKGFKDASALRKKLVLVKNYSEMKDILSNIRH